jgi:hypothetical protein
MEERTLLVTLTGEYFQPVRLHYRVLDQPAVLQRFQELRCVDHDATRERWVWLYDHEARGLRFKKSYADLPKHLQPVIIGSFFLHGADKLVLDLRSIERATEAILFFDKHLSRSLARVVEAEVVNRLFPIRDAQVTPDSIFDHQASTYIDPEAAVQRTKELVAGIAEPHERLRLALEDMQSRAREPLPEIERFPIHYYEEGIEGFRNVLQMRQIVALQHLLGNSEYSLYDVLQAMVNRK